MAVINIHWLTYTADEVLLAEKKIEWKSHDHILLDVSCDGGCGQGVFSITEEIHDLLKSQKEFSEIHRVCPSPSYQSPDQACGAKFKAQISIKFK